MWLVSKELHKYMYKFNAKGYQGDPLAQVVSVLGEALELSEN